MVANVNTMMTDGGGGGASDSFIVNGGGQSFEECATSYAAVAEKMIALIQTILEDFAGIDWTDDQGISFQATAGKFKDESDKVPDRLRKNSKILNELASSAMQLNTNVQNSIDSAYGA